MHHPCHRRSCARLDIGRGARNRAGRWQTTECHRPQIGNALADQLLIRPVPGTGHAIGDDRREQRLDSGQKGDREGRRKQFDDFCPGQDWKRRHR